MKYILDIDLLKGYEEITVMMLDQIIKDLYSRGIIKINKQEKIGEPEFDILLREYKRRELARNGGA